MLESLSISGAKNLTTLPNLVDELGASVLEIALVNLGIVDLAFLSSNESEYGMEHLNKLSIRCMPQLAIIARSTFALLKACKQLTLSNNAVTKIESGAFEGMASLTLLELNHNRGEYITWLDSCTLCFAWVYYIDLVPLAFEGMVSLTLLELNHSRGEYITWLDSSTQSLIKSKYDVANIWIRDLAIYLFWLFLSDPSTLAKHFSNPTQRSLNHI